MSPLTVKKTYLHSVNFVWMCVSTFLFKIKYLTPNLINSCSAKRKYSYIIAGCIQLMSRKEHDRIDYGDTLRESQLILSTIHYMRISNSGNVMHSCAHTLGRNNVLLKGDDGYTMCLCTFILVMIYHGRTDTVWCTGRKDQNLWTIEMSRVDI